ncbi:hypothetical protein PACTADRAFT_51517 [Pachysolen tannophilus NRRL Y-2460]|uniref:Alpha/beta hydrolase fold-3 domain-containing protein n=1 Tax=Pachysolen tannophilus NRRL Y-2460 TaxID=669874 RepID=A0A1E4TPT3_PACTA|nr:hypothetical protein PACTADRAFT_51517 [Pachysolen tannophilus NRRL Y-2460]
MMGSPYIYLEYLQCLLVVLQEQGFKNPAVFIQIFTPIPKGVYPYHLEETVKGWSYVLKENPTSNCIIIGDSTGATLILSLLLFLAKPNFEMINATESDINLTKPLAAFLISPIPKFNISDNIQKNHQNALEICPDILTKKIVNNWGKNYIPDFDFDSEENSENPENCGYHSPGLCNDEEWWKNAFPEFGIVISYGAEELLAPEIDFLTTNLKKFGKVKVDKHNAHVHDWPILTYFTERTQEDREESIQYFAGVISRMLLWNTETYFSSNAKEPTNILKIDYEYS